MAIGGIVSLVGTVQDATDGIESVIQAPQLEQGPTPIGFGEGSLMRPAAVKSALAQMNADEVRLTNLRLAPERIDATLLTTEGRLRHVQMKAGGKPRAPRHRRERGLRQDADDPVRGR